MSKGKTGPHKMICIRESEAQNDLHLEAQNDKVSVDTMFRSCEKLSKNASC